MAWLAGAFALSQLFINIDLMLFVLSIVVKPSGLWNANPWHYPLPRLLWFVVLITYGVFAYMPRWLRVTGAGFCCCYWVGWLIRDFLWIGQPLEVWPLWVWYLPLIALSTGLFVTSMRPNFQIQPTRFVRG